MLLYFHVPFCRAKCRYCAFYSQPLTDDTLLDAWVSALEADMAAWARRFAQRGEVPLIKSIFFG